MPNARITLSSIVLSAAVLGAAGCSNEATTETVTDRFTANLTLACIEADSHRSFGGAVAATGLERCVYGRAAKTLAVNFEGAASGVNIDIVDFTGPGTYATATAETGTSIWIFSPDEAQGGTFESDPPGSFPAHACTIHVTKTNLHEVTIPEASSATGYLVLDVACPAIGHGAVSAFECSVAPSTFSFAVAACSATP